MRRAALSIFALAVPVFVPGCGACGPGMLGDLPTDTDSTSTSEGAEITSTGSGDTESDGPPRGDWLGIQYSVPRDIDILFVIDDSSSMGLPQLQLVQNFGTLWSLLEDPEVSANARIAVTTTDLGNPGCATTPEDGAFVATTCRQRLSDFVDDEQDWADDICLATCLADFSTLATTTDLDPEPAPRPWIEIVEGVTNLPDGVSMAQAGQCILGQGIAGCEFVSPLEAAKRALERARTPGDPAYGFLRDSAHLFIAIVTDTDDCSSPFEQRAIFLTPQDCYDADGDGDATDDCTQVYWTDPEASAPTPGVCWNAGVSCTGAMPEPDGTTSFEDCQAADKGLDGDAVAPADAVLHPITRYASWVAELRAEKAAHGAVGVTIAASAGIPIGGGVGPIPFATSTDPDVNVEYGIGPSCERPTLLPPYYAMPPVRLRELVAEHGAVVADAEPTLESVCAGDFTAMFEPAVNALRHQLTPACVPACVADLDPATDALDFDCEVRQTLPPEAEPTVETLPSCIDDEVPDGANACWVAVTGEDVSPYCVDEDWNLEVRIVRREGHPVPGGTTVEISCVYAGDTDAPCP